MGEKLVRLGGIGIDVRGIGPSILLKFIRDKKSSRKSPGPSAGLARACPFMVSN